MFESPRSLWQHFAVAIVAVLVIMSLSSVNANNENDQWMLIKFDFSSKRRSCREVRIRNRYFENRDLAHAQTFCTRVTLTRIKKNVTIPIKLM